MNETELTLLQKKTKKTPIPRLVAAAMTLGERRGSSTMNVKATCSFNADRHVLSSAVIQEGSVG